MERYIETVGTGKGEEKAVRFRASLELSAHTKDKDEPLQAPLLSLRNRCIETLLASGMRQDELHEGGAAVWNSWWVRSSQRERTASHTILVVCDDATRLQVALRALDPLFDGKRFTLGLSMRPADFHAPEEAHRVAQSAAIVDARKTADNLAGAAGLRVTGVLAVIDSRVYRGRAMRDYGGGRAMVYSMGSSSDDEEPMALETPTQQFAYECEVRFACEAVG